MHSSVVPRAPTLCIIPNQLFMEQPVKDKLDTLLDLQKIDGELDTLQRLKGELPEEVTELEDELAGLHTRLQRLTDEVEGIAQEIEQHKNDAQEAEHLMRKYSEQQMSIKNSREYDAINKEIELQKIDIKICEKKVKLCYEQVDEKKEAVAVTNDLIGQKKKGVQEKKAELEVITEDNKVQEKKLEERRKKLVKKIEERLYKKYEALRNNKLNGRAVVLVKRDACDGCFNQVPPQRQVEIREKRKLIFCEYCGCFLAGCEDELLEAAS